MIGVIQRAAGSALARAAVLGVAGVALAGCSLGSYGTGTAGSLTTFGYDYGTVNFNFQASCNNNQVAGALNWSDPSFSQFESGPALNIQGTTFPWKASCSELASQFGGTVLQTGFFHSLSDGCISQSEGMAGLDTCNGLYVFTIGKDGGSVVNTAESAALKLGQTVTLRPVTVSGGTGYSGYSYALILFDAPFLYESQEPALVAIPFYENDGPVFGHIAMKA
jgi:hypothetical protein